MPLQCADATEHTVSVAAPAGVVYGMLADAVRWPVLRHSQVHVERMDFDGAAEQLRVWDLADGRVRDLHARRVLDAQTRSIAFEQRDARWPDAPTLGSWNVRPQGEKRSLVSLRQDGANAAELRAQVAEVQEMAESWARLDEILVAFEDSVHIGGPAELVYDFLYRIQDWAGLVPHVEWTRASEDRPGVQLVAQDTCAGDDGGTVSVQCVRLCFPHAGRIVHKDTAPPELIAGHSGEWYLVPDDHGVRVVSEHRVMLREEAVGRVLGEKATLADARRHVRERLGRESTETLGLAKWHVQSAIRRLR
jgi:aromatase